MSGGSDGVDVVRGRGVKGAEGVVEIEKGRKF